MAIRIDTAIEEISDISITVHIDRMGPRQRPAFVRMLNSGVIVGGGIPGEMARKLRNGAGLPWVLATSWRLAWGHAGGHMNGEEEMLRFQHGMKAVITLEYDERDNQTTYGRQMHDEMLTQLDRDEGRMWRYGSKFSTPIKQLKLKLPKWVGAVPRTVTMNGKDMSEAEPQS